MVDNLSLIPERELIKQCLGNNRLAQKEMYERLSPRMFSVCIRYIGDKYKAQDVLHDGFITLFAKLRTFKGDGSFEGWARRIFINTALMQIRKADVLKNSEDIEAPHIDLKYSDNIIDKIDADKLFAIISQMPSGFRTVFNLYVIEGYSHDEIAKALNITEGGSRSQLSRAREWLKIRMKDFIDDKDFQIIGNK